MAFSGVVGAICCDTGNVLIGGDLGQQFGQHGGIPDVAAGDLDRPDLQRLFVDPEMDKDRRYDNIRTVTLSYTFFEAKTERARTLLGGVPAADTGKGG